MRIHLNRYEFHIYSKLRDNLESGYVFIADSADFRSFQADLVDDERWETDKQQLIMELDLSILNNPIEKTLGELEEEVEALFVCINKRIKEGKNESIKLKGSGKNISWTLPYKKPEDRTNHPIFARLPQVEIRDVIAGRIPIFQVILEKVK